MHRPLRSVLHHGREAASLSPELHPYFRSFSTTFSRAQPDDDSSKRSGPPSQRQRSAAAASQLSVLTAALSAAPSLAGALASQNDASGSQVSTRSQAGSSANASDGAKIIRMTSLPRRRGGGFGGLPRGGGASGFTIRRVGDDGADVDTVTLQRGRGGLRGRGGRGGGRGGRGRGRRRNNSDRNSRDEEAQATTEEWEPETQEWLDGEAQGRESEYTPTTTLDSLAGYGPGIASSEAGQLGNMENVMRNLRILGGGIPFSDGENPSWMRDRKMRGENIFFNDVQLRRDMQGLPATEEKRTPSNETKEAIMKYAVAGHYQSRQFAPATDPLGTLRNYAVGNSTYRAQDVRALDAHVSARLPQRPSSSTKAAGAQP